LRAEESAMDMKDASAMTDSGLANDYGCIELAAGARGPLTL